MRITKSVNVPRVFHKELKKRAVDEDSTIEKVIAEILREEFHIQGD